MSTEEHSPSSDGLESPTESSYILVSPKTPYTEEEDSGFEPFPAFEDRPSSSLSSRPSSSLSSRPTTPRPRPVAPKARFFRRGRAASDSGSNSTIEDECQEILRKRYTKDLISELESEGEHAPDGEQDECGNEYENGERKTDGQQQKRPRTPPNQTNLPISTPGAPKADHKKRYGRGLGLGRRGRGSAEDRWENGSPRRKGTGLIKP